MAQPVELLYAVPVGTVISWFPPPNAFVNGAMILPPGFALCDGTSVEDQDSPFYSQATPDLSARFVLGASQDGVPVGQPFGSPEFNVDGWQSGALETTPTLSAPQDFVPNNIVQNFIPDANCGYLLTFDGSIDGNHHHEVAGLTIAGPGSVALFFIMRIK
jgi:hypothetical protein